MFTALDGRSVIVTGGSKGIGKGIARVFARAGANVLVAARDEATLQAAAEDLAKESGGRVETVVADVAKVDDCRRIADAAVERFGGIDVLCANAGVFPEKLLDGDDRGRRRRGLRLQRQGHDVLGAGLPARRSKRAGTAG